MVRRTKIHPKENAMGTRDTIWIRAFERKIKKYPGACWVWLGARTPLGYGKASKHGRSIAAHRLAWEIENGPIPEGGHILHRCDNPCCCRPDHLFLGDHVLNMKDRDSKNRQPKGETCGKSKLTEKQVLEIRSRWPNESQSAIGLAFGIRQSHVQKIVGRLIWKHI